MYTQQVRMSMPVICLMVTDLLPSVCEFCYASQVYVYEYLSYEFYL